MCLLEASLVIFFPRVAMTVIITGQPKCMDSAPHGVKEFVQPLALRVEHGDVTTDALLLLKVCPFYREFSPEKVVPSDGGLFLE